MDAIREDQGIDDDGAAALPMDSIWEDNAADEWLRTVDDVRAWQNLAGPSARFAVTDGNAATATGRPPSMATTEAAHATGLTASAAVNRASDMTCPICLDELEPNADAESVGGGVIAAGCGHCFHEGCIQAWYASQKGLKTCPMCRQCDPSRFNVRVGGADMTLTIGLDGVRTSPIPQAPLAKAPPLPTAPPQPRPETLAAALERRAAARRPGAKLRPSPPPAAELESKSKPQFIPWNRIKHVATRPGPRPRSRPQLLSRVVSRVRRVIRAGRGRRESAKSGRLELVRRISFTADDAGPQSPTADTMEIIDITLADSDEVAGLDPVYKAFVLHMQQAGRSMATGM